MKAIPGGHNLFVADVEVVKMIENLYNKFKVSCLYLISTFYLYMILDFWAVFFKSLNFI